MKEEETGPKKKWKRKRNVFERCGCEKGNSREENLKNKRADFKLKPKLS
jgi:hypothetical protein